MPALLRASDDPAAGVRPVRLILAVAGTLVLLPAPLARAAPRAPKGPPLVSHGTAQARTGEEAQSLAQPADAGDPLVGNGLGSPLCSRGAAAGGLSQAGAAQLPHLRLPGGAGAHVQLRVRRERGTRAQSNTSFYAAYT